MESSGGAVVEHLLLDRLLWYIAGPIIGLLVVGLFAIANRPLGVSGAYVSEAKRSRCGTAESSCSVGVAAPLTPRSTIPRPTPGDQPAHGSRGMPPISWR